MILVDSWKQLEQDADKIGTVTFMKWGKGIQFFDRWRINVIQFTDDP